MDDAFISAATCINCIVNYKGVSHAQLTKHEQMEYPSDDPIYGS